MVFKDSIAEIKHVNNPDKLIRLFRCGKYWVQQCCDISDLNMPIALTWDRISATAAKKQLKLIKNSTIYNIEYS